jgi:hypothetical protein
VTTSATAGSSTTAATMSVGLGCISTPVSDTTYYCTICSKDLELQNMKSCSEGRQARLHDSVYSKAKNVSQLHHTMTLTKQNFDNTECLCNESL